jgi:hypothetical protein
MDSIDSFDDHDPSTAEPPIPEEEGLIPATDVLEPTVDPLDEEAWTGDRPEAAVPAATDPENGAGSEEGGEYWRHNSDPEEPKFGSATWDEGRRTEKDVIEARDTTGYTSVSGYVSGTGGYDKDE